MSFVRIYKNEVNIILKAENKRVNKPLRFLRERMYMRKVSNPLTIIGIFAGIAEVAGTAVLPLMSEPLQKIFIWYVISKGSTFSL